jgi:subtilisin-like proprotein convertase family protein/Ca2+-binding RTX toxin-like protein
MNPQLPSEGEIISDASTYLTALPAKSAYISHKEEGGTLLATLLGVEVVIGGAGDDVLVAAPSGSWLIGEGGYNEYRGDEGDDVFVINAHEEFMINGGGGTNTLIISGDEGVKLVDAFYNIQFIYGGKGNDLIKIRGDKCSIDGGEGFNKVILEENHTDYHVVQTADHLLLTSKLPHHDKNITLSNIQEIRFADTLYINNASLPFFTPIADDLYQNQSGQALTRLYPNLIAASQLLSNDHTLNNPSALRISAVSHAVGGKVNLTLSGDVLFTPDPNFMGLMQFKYEISNTDAQPAAHLLSLKEEGTTLPTQAIVSLLTPDLPRDPFFTQQWSLTSAHVVPVWEDYTGKGVRISQFEPDERLRWRAAQQSVDLQHSDLSSVIDSKYLLARIGEAEFNNHATAVASVMVAAKNDQGMVGVAYEAKLTVYIDEKMLAPMLDSDVANHSWSTEEPFKLGPHDQEHEVKLFFNLIKYIGNNGRGGKGTVMVATAGNGYAQGVTAQHCLFSNSRFNIQVGATHAPTEPSREQFSSPGASVLLSAPGHAMWVAKNTQPTPQGRKDNFFLASGTSVAAPLVSGIVALMLEANPNLGYRDVQTILAVTARRVDPTYTTPTTWDENAARNWNGGGMHMSYTYGFGSVDARAAVRLAETWLEENIADNEAVISMHYPTEDTIITKTSQLTLSTDSTLNIEHVEIDIDIHSAQLKDVSVTLISPSGTQSTLLYNDPYASLNSLHHTFMSTRHWSESAQGKWTLEVATLNASQPVSLHHWALRLYGKASSVDNTYFYTDEYETLSKTYPQRAILDDAINGAAGGRNTLHAAAVTGNTIIDLSTGQVSLGGSPLTIADPSTIHNLISGDGDDILVANDEGAILAAGRGHNILKGGAGADLFVIQRRQGGSDTVENFNALQGDKIVLVGFRGKSLADFAVTQQEQDIHLTLGNQSLLIKDQLLAKIELPQILALQDSFTAPGVYVDSTSTVWSLQENHSVIHLVGGEAGVQWREDTDNSEDEYGKSTRFSEGTVYRHDRATSNQFVVMPQPEALNYHNALQGFKPGIDKIDVHHLGISDFSSLYLEKIVRDKNETYKVPIIHGSNVLAKLNQADSLAKILYIDAIEPSQITESDFIFAEVDKGIKQPELAVWEHHINGLTNNLIHTLATANKEASICPIEDKYYTNDTALFYGHAPEHVSFTG